MKILRRWWPLLFVFPVLAVVWAVDAQVETAPVGRAEPGDLVGVASLLGAERYTTTARCAEPCGLLALGRAPLLEVLRRNPEADRAVLAAVARSYFTRYEALLGRLQAILVQVSG